jgi:hypothetical protein
MVADGISEPVFDSMSEVETTPFEVEVRRGLEVGRVLVAIADPSEVTTWLE